MTQIQRELVHWWTSGLLLFIFFLAAGYNLRTLIMLPRKLPKGEHGPSPLPLVGGLFGLFACLNAPSPVLRFLCWLPLLLDPGSGYYLLLGLRSFRREQLQQAEQVRQDADARSGAGCLLGTAVGDALGLAVEGLSRRRQQAMFPGLDHYHFLLGKGFCSDDTEHACMTANALISAGYLQESFSDCFQRSLAWRLRFWLLGLPAGVGLATGRGIIKLWFGFSPDRSGVFSAGNGPAMRAPILGVCYGTDRELLKQLNRISTRLTHTDPRAEQAAYAVALAAYHASRSLPFQAAEFLADLEQAFGAACKETSAALAAAFDSVARGESTAAFAETIGCGNGVSGYALHTVPVCLHAWLCHRREYREAVLSVIHCGGDADTTAAILGGIVGAEVGREGIPQAWLDDLKEWPRTVDWIERLGMAAASSARPAAADTDKLLTLHPPLFVPWLPVRNLLFLVVVLLHGFRRLLPPY